MILDFFYESTISYKLLTSYHICLFDSHVPFLQNILNHFWHFPLEIEIGTKSIKLFQLEKLVSEYNIRLPNTFKITKA